MKFCSQCGNPSRTSSLSGDNRTRYVCTIWRHHPLPESAAIVAGCLVFHEQQVLAVPPRNRNHAGWYWTLPAGYIGKTANHREAPLRETGRSPRPKVPRPIVYIALQLPLSIRYTLFFLGELVDQALRRRRREPEVRLVRERPDIPWA